MSKNTEQKPSLKSIDEFLLGWRWFKGDRAAWIAGAVSFIAWGLFSILISEHGWQITGSSLVAAGVQLACYIYIAARYIASRDQGNKSADLHSVRRERWMLSTEAARLTPPVAGLGAFITLLGAVSEFAPELLADLGVGVSHDVTICALIVGPLLVIVCMRLMLAQTAAR